MNTCLTRCGEEARVKSYLLICFDNLGFILIVPPIRFGDPSSGNSRLGDLLFEASYGDLILDFGESASSISFKCIVSNTFFTSSDLVKIKIEEQPFT